jgi:hypothetical protein
MQDDLSRAERYDSLATVMRLTAEYVDDEKRRAELLTLANQYRFLGLCIAKLESWKHAFRRVR